MEASFTTVMKEEQISRKLGMKEDLEDMRMEQEELRKKALLKKQMRNRWNYPLQERNSRLTIIVLCEISLTSNDPHMETFHYTDTLFQNCGLIYQDGQYVKSQHIYAPISEIIQFH